MPETSARVGEGLRVALELARRGGRILILCPPKEDRSCGCGSGHVGKAVGKAPISGLMPRGVADATANTATISRWFERFPTANVGVALEGADWVVADPDSPETLAEVLRRGVPPTLVRESKNRAFVFRWPAEAPRCSNIIRQDGAPLDVLTTGYLVVHGRHASGVDVYLDRTAEPADPPEWLAEMIRTKAAGEAERAARRERRRAAADGDDEPPVRLQADALERWHGRLVERTPDGEVDRSVSLFYLGLDLAEAGASRTTIVKGLAGRDAVLGWDKYTDRRDATEYGRIADKAIDRDEERKAAPRIEFVASERVNGAAGERKGHAGEKQQKRERRAFELTRLEGLLTEPAEEFEYLVDGLMIVGGVSLVAAKPKVGKSTTIRNAAYAVASGGEFLGRSARRGPVVYLGLEEKRSQVRQHFARMGASDEPIYVHVGAAPEAALEALEQAIGEHGAVLAIGDPAFKLIRLRDGNDYTEVTRALEPVIELARLTSCHIALVHHMGKGERAGGDAILGSTALFGAVDAALLMRRRDQIRTIESIQRYGEDMPETVVTLDPMTGLVRRGGDLAALRLEEVGCSVMEVVGDEALDEADIRERVGGNRGLVGMALRKLVEDGTVVRSGEGKRGAPYLYGRPSGTPAISADSPISRFSHTEKREKRENEKPAPSENGGSPRCALCLERPMDGGDLCRDCEDRLDDRLEGPSSG